MKPRRVNIASDNDERAQADSPVPEHESGSRHTGGETVGSGLKKALWILGAVLVTGYVAGAVGLRALVDTDALRAWIAPRASDVLNRPVSVGEARVALLPRPSIHVSDVRVDNLADFDGPVLAYLERVRLDLRLMPLLVGRVAVEGIELDGPRFHLAIDETGASNFGDLLPGGGGPASAPRAPLSLGVEHVEVSDATVSYFDGTTERSFTVAGMDVDAAVSALDPGGWTAEVVARSDSLLLRLASVSEDILRTEGPRVSLTATADPSDGSVDIAQGTVAMSEATLALSGRLYGLDGDHPSYDLQFTNDAMDAGVLAEAFPAAARSRLMPAMDGRVGMTFQLTSADTPGHPPLVRGSLSLEDIGVRMSGKLMVDRVRGLVGFTTDSLLVDSLTGTFADGPFALSGTVARDPGAVKLAVRAEPDLDALDRLGFVPDGMTISGDAAFDVSFDGTLDAMDSADVTGTVALSGVQAKHRRLGAPLYFPSGELALLGDGVAWAELDVLVGQDPLVSTGRLEGLAFLARTVGEAPVRVDASVRGARLDLGSLLLDGGRDSLPAYGRVAFAHLGERRVDGRVAAEIASERGLRPPASLPLRGTVDLEVDTLDYGRYPMRSVVARVAMSDSALTVDATSLEIWGGSSTAALTVRTGRLTGAPFTLRMTTDGVSAEPFLATLTPVGDAVSGTLGLDLAVTGTLDDGLLPTASELAGRIRVSIADGEVADTGPNLVIGDFLGSDEWTHVTFDSWSSEIEIEGRRLDVLSSRLAGDRARIALSGLVGLDGTHDLSVGISIPPERLETVSLRRTGIGQTVLDHLSAAGSSLDLGLRMSGRLAAPVVEPDASNAVASAR